MPYLYRMLLLTDADKAFILTHAEADTVHLLLHPPGHLPPAHLAELVRQIQARQKARLKLPRWYANPNLIFPSPLSVEQASSELAATYKASLVSGHSLADLTGGMGVDSAAFANRVGQVTYLEHDTELARRTALNLPQLGHTNITVVAHDGLTWLKNQPAPLDWLYLDPARRNGQGRRVVGLAECEPNVLTHLPLLLANAGQVLLKTAPLLDINLTLRQLTTAHSVQVVAVQGDVKELLFVLGRTPVPIQDVQITAINLFTATRQEQLTYLAGEETAAPVRLANPQTYLYEPNAAVLKAGAFRLVGHRFGLAKLAPHSHLYTSDELVTNFPGRVFGVEAVCRADRNALRQHVPDGQANLTVRNFPESVATLRQKLGLREGGNRFIFATTLQNRDKRLLITYKAVL